MSKYFLDFYNNQDPAIQLKIEWTLGLIRDLDKIPSKYFKHVTGAIGLYEIRVEFESNVYRIFPFFDEGNMIILGNAFQKKSQKIPKSQIRKAIKIKKENFDKKE